jgi:DNA-binding MarR family transcriptional regulator
LFLNHVLADLGLKPVGYAILSILTATDATPGDVARMSGTRPSTLSGHISQLVKQGWIDRQRGDDGRVAVLTLTAAGRDIHAQASRRVSKRVIAMEKTMDMPLNSARQALRELSKGLDQAMETPKV